MDDADVVALAGRGFRSGRSCRCGGGRGCRRRRLYLDAVAGKQLMEPVPGDAEGAHDLGDRAVHHVRCVTVAEPVRDIASEIAFLNRALRGGSRASPTRNDGEQGLARERRARSTAADLRHRIHLADHALNGP